MRCLRRERSWSHHDRSQGFDDDVTQGIDDPDHAAAGIDANVAGDPDHAAADIGASGGHVTDRAATSTDATGEGTHRHGPASYEPASDEPAGYGAAPYGSTGHGAGDHDDEPRGRRGWHRVLAGPHRSTHRCTGLV
jgi:hypothetical protein